MDATLPEIGHVARFWKPYISPLLNEAIKDRFVWNLLPQSHRDAWTDEHRYAHMVDVKFYDNTNGERKAITHGVKPLRGQLVNFLVREMVEGLEVFKEWEHPAGYRYDEGESAHDEASRTTTIAMVKNV